MTGLLRLTFSALFLSTVLATAASVYPEGAVALGVDFWNLPALERQMAESERYSAELDEWGQAICTRLESKHRVTLDLLAGRLSLLQAAVRFRDLNAGGRHNPADLRNFFPGRSEAERVCRQVVCWVSEDSQATDPEQGLFLHGRLEKELQQLLASGRPISWPDRPTP
jgi:hypothetical protein